MLVFELDEEFLRFHLSTEINNCIRLAAVFLFHNDKTHFFLKVTTDEEIRMEAKDFEFPIPWNSFVLVSLFKIFTFHLVNFNCAYTKCLFVRNSMWFFFLLFIITVPWICFVFLGQLINWIDSKKKKTILRQNQHESVVYFIVLSIVRTNRKWFEIKLNRNWTRSDLAIKFIEMLVQISGHNTTSHFNRWIGEYDSNYSHLLCFSYFFELVTGYCYSTRNYFDYKFQSDTFTMCVCVCNFRVKERQ